MIENIAGGVPEYIHIYIYIYIYMYFPRETLLPCLVHLCPFAGRATSIEEQNCKEMSDVFSPIFSQQLFHIGIRLELGPAYCVPVLIMSSAMLFVLQISVGTRHINMIWDVRGGFSSLLFTRPCREPSISHVCQTRDTRTELLCSFVRCRNEGSLYFIVAVPRTCSSI